MEKNKKKIVRVRIPYLTSKKNTSITNTVLLYKWTR